MRKHFAPAALAATVLGLGGLAGFAGSAAASPPDEPIDIGAILDILTPEQFTCIAQEMMSVAEEDLGAVMGVMEECGVTLDQLLEVATGQATVEESAPATGQTAVEEATPATTAPGTGTPLTGEPDADTITAVLEHFGIGSDDLTCIADGLAAATPGDDNAALLVLQECGLSLSTILEAMALTQGAPTVPTTTIAGSDTPSATTGDMLTDLMISTFESMGMTITPEQAQCLGEAAMGGVDTTDMTAMMDLLGECGIEITDLLGG